MRKTGRFRWDFLVLALGLLPLAVIAALLLVVPSWMSSLRNSGVKDHELSGVQMMTIDLYRIVDYYLPLLVILPCLLTLTGFLLVAHQRRLNRNQPAALP